MDQEQRLDRLIAYRLEEEGMNETFHSLSLEEKKKLYRGLMNVRVPKPLPEWFLELEDDYLQEERDPKKEVDVNDLKAKDRLVLWQGDITTLRADTIVNAANHALLGCFVPNHSCIDNAIHSKAGAKLRLECEEIMERQGHDEKTGMVKITKGYNLPAKYVLHTVGPIVYGRVTEQNKKDLKNAYWNCLKLAKEKGLRSVVFCCISTGEFHFPNDLAAKIAVDTVKKFFKEFPDCSIEKVVFNVFKDEDKEFYKYYLGRGEEKCV